MIVDLQPTLIGELIMLRPLQADDWDALFAVAADPLIWEQHPIGFATRKRCSASSSV